MALKVAFKSLVASRFLCPTIITGIKVVPIKKIFFQASSYPLFLADSMGCKRIVSFEKKKLVAITRNHYPFNCSRHSASIISLFKAYFFVFPASYKSHTFLWIKTAFFVGAQGYSSVRNWDWHCGQRGENFTDWKICFLQFISILKVILYQCRIIGNF